MEALKIEGEEKTPTIIFEPDGSLLLKGRSIPENTVAFYEPVFNWLKEFGNNPAQNIILTVQLEYFNTSSSKCLLDIFRALEDLKSKSKNEVKIIWNYEEDDEDIMEAGEDYQSIVDLEFELQSIDD